MSVQGLRLIIQHPAGSLGLSTITCVFIKTSKDAAIRAVISKSSKTKNRSSEDLAMRRDSDDLDLSPTQTGRKQAVMWVGVVLSHHQHVSAAEPVHCGVEGIHHLVNHSHDGSALVNCAMSSWTQCPHRLGGHAEIRLFAEQ